MLKRRRKRGGFFNHLCAADIRTLKKVTKTLQPLPMPNRDAYEERVIEYEVGQCNCGQEMRFATRTLAVREISIEEMKKRKGIL